MFDPYQEWLGIAKNERPITCYRLLGVSPKENDAEKIRQAADAQAFLVVQHKGGQNAPLAAKLLREIEQAKATLLDPAKRKAYDARRQGAAARPQVVEDAEVVEEAIEVVEAVVAEPAGRRREPERSAPAKARRRSEEEKEPAKKSKGSAVLLVAVAGVAAVLVLAGGGVAAMYLLSKKEPESQPLATIPPPVQAAAPAPAPTALAKKETPAPTPPSPAPVKPPEPAKPVAPPAPKPPPPKPAEKVVKLPVPDAAAQARAEAALKEKYKADYSRTRPEDQLVLSAKFLQPGREDRKDPAGWFVLLREARDLAVLAKRPRLAIEAINEIDRWFIIDALGMKLKTLSDIGTSNNEFTVAATVRTCLNLVQQAYNEENFDTARRFIEIAENALKEIKSPKLNEMVRDHKNDIEVYFREYQKTVQARSKLMQLPDDPEANFVVGQYLSFFQAKWDEGLPLLAKGSEAALKKLALQDLGQPAEVKDQLAIADAWWGWSKGQKDRVQRNILKRSTFWYERCGPNTKGDDKNIVIARIKESREKEYARILRLLPGSFYGRDPESRVLLLREGGGNMKSEEAIERGLEWLAKHQSANGSWTTDAFHRAAQCKCTEHGEKHDVAGTAFGLLPFLGAGETHRQGRYKETVARGIDYLVRQQKPAGNFHDNAYENALASIAVIEAFGISKDARLRLPALAAATYIVRAQDSGGSWGYSAGNKGDTSVSGWQFTALKAAAYANFPVPKDTFDRLSTFLDSVADAGGLGYGYNSPGAGVSTSAVGVLCREFLSWGPGHPMLSKEMDFLVRPDNFPTKDKISMYSVFYITQAVHHFGGHHWEKWNGAVRDLLIELQDKGDDPKHTHQKGSWSPRNDPYAKQGGRLMFTSLSLITLEAYYYHIPLYGYGPSVFD